MNEYCDARFPPWDRVDWSSWTPLREQLTALRFGHYALRLDMFEGGLPETAELRPARQAYSLPAVIALADRPSLLLEAWGSGRAAANQALQNVMLRLLTSLPPGKVQFTIFDPVGLGQNFSAFMHLADFDEALVTHRIWTETAHIQQRLADLTQHMEDVIQTYLRNEFTTIHEYNENAGRSGRAVPGAGGCQLSRRILRRGGAAIVEHRRQRIPLRRLHADQHRFET